MKKQFPDVEARHGAPVGRTPTLDNPAASVHVFCVRFVDYDYDDGGAYWGGGEPLYCARDDEGEFETFIRAKSHKAACRQFLVLFPDLKIIEEFPIEDMLNAYLVCALWSSVDEEGSPLDDDKDVDDIATKSVDEAREECQDFIYLAQLEGYDLSQLDPTQIGHDFWLTRNHHGAGFWDRGMGKLGDDLTKLAQAYGEVDAYVGDDGKVYFE